MPSVDVLCLAYSMKHGGRCVAGVRTDSGGWVRPVSGADDGSLTPSACLLDVGRPVRPLDVVRLSMTEPRPAPHQPENWVVSDDQWKLVEERSMQSAAADLEAIVEKGTLLLGIVGKSIDWQTVEADGVSASLGLVRVSKPHFVVNPWNRFRAKFEYGGTHYDLSCTDLSAWQSHAYSAGGLYSESDWYLTVSLGEPWEDTNACYKVVAAGLEIPT